MARDELYKMNRAGFHQPIAIDKNAFSFRGDSLNLIEMEKPRRLLRSPAGIYVGRNVGEHAFRRERKWKLTGAENPAKRRHRRSQNETPVLISEERSRMNNA